MTKEEKPNPLLFSPRLTRSAVLQLKNPQKLQLFQQHAKGISTTKLNTSTNKTRNNNNLMGDSGAPEGELLVDLVVLSREQILLRSEEEKKEQKVQEEIAQIQKCQLSDWMQIYQSIDLIRTIVLRHSDHLILPNHLDIFITVLHPAISNLRSAISRNAILAVEEIFSVLKQNAQSILQTTVPILLSRLIDEKKFIRDATQKALEESTDVCAGLELIEILLKSSNDKVPVVVSWSGILFERCLKRIRSSSLNSDSDWLNQIDKELLLKGLGEFALCKVVDCRAAVKGSLRLIRKELGDCEFVDLVGKYLSGSMKADVLKFSTEIKKSTAHRGMSLKQRMLLAKKSKIESA